MKKLVLVILFMEATFAIAAAQVTQNGSASISGTRAEEFRFILLGGSNESGPLINDGSSHVWSLPPVVFFSNVKNWKVSLSSLNGGYLVNTSDATEKIPYLVTLVPLVYYTQLLTPWTSAPQPMTKKSGDVHEYFEILYNPDALDDLWQAGTYTDTITVTIFHE